MKILFNTNVTSFPLKLLKHQETHKCIVEIILHTTLDMLLPICNRRQNLVLQNKILVWTLTMLWIICHHIKSLSESLFVNRATSADNFMVIYSFLKIIRWYQSLLFSYIVCFSCSILKRNIFVMLLPWAAQAQLHQQHYWCHLLWSSSANKCGGGYCSAEAPGSSPLMQCHWTHSPLTAI